MTHIRRNTCFNPERNMTTTFGELILGQYPYDEELAGPDGMHFHVWVPKGTTKEQLYEIRDAIAANRDLVSFSYDYQPEKKIKADTTLPAGIDALRAIVEEKSLKVVKWPDGTTHAVDVFTANAVITVYDALNEENQAKTERMLAASPGKFMVIVNFCFSAVK